MRIVLLGVSTLLTSMMPPLAAEPEPGPDIEQIAELIRQLGSENFRTREDATARLAAMGLAARDALEVAGKSPDPEVRQRAGRILQSMEGLLAQQSFLDAMKGGWPEALREGRLSGPLLGVAEMEAKPLPVDERSFGVAEEGFRFLSRIQSADGRWSARVFGAQMPADVEQTAFASLSFLGAGHTEKVGQYKQTVRNAIAWMKQRQRGDGAILNEGWTQVDSVSHALAMVALSESAGMANVQDTKAAAQRAVDFAVRLQDPRTGGFGRMADVRPDLFSTTMYVLALKSAKVAGLNVPHSAFEGLIRFLDSVEDKEAKSYRYVPGGKTLPQAAVLGVVCRQFLGWKKEDLRETVVVALKGLGEPTVDRDESDMLSNYFGTLAAFQQGGEIWKEWNEPLKKNLCDGQVRAGPADGAWAPRGVWAGGGYVLSTALNGLALEVYYRYLPMYK